MTQAIHLYIEGGGDGKETRARLRRAFNQFLDELVTTVRNKRIRWRLVTCGSKDSTFDDYQTGRASYPNALHILLVDSDAPVTSKPWQHLRTHDNWSKPSGVRDEHCHLMVQAMEAWLIADRRALRDFYGRQFNENSLPNNQNVEEVPKNQLESALRKASQRTQKGPYHKTRHAPYILQNVQVSQVRNRAEHCDRLFRILQAQIDAIH